MKSGVAGRLTLFSLVLVAARATRTPLGARSATRRGRDVVAARQLLPQDVAREVASLFNAAVGVRATDGSRSRLGGRSKGTFPCCVAHSCLPATSPARVIAVNADVILQPTARIDGDLIVVGGEVEGRRAARIGGRDANLSTAAAVHTSGRRLVADVGTRTDDGWWRRWDGAGSAKR